MDAPLRIAVVSTPRVGNTWVRHLLAAAYQVPHVARHWLADKDWAELPPEVVLQIHWRHEPAFVAELESQGFRVVTVARHPLDVLVSILHFCVYESESEGWLLGAGGTEADIYGAMPRSRAFVEYAKGPRAAQLLAVMPDWWGRPGVLGVRYEDCVRDPEGEVRRLESEFGPVRCASRADAVAACSLARLRQRATNNHFWKGSPGLWRTLLAAAEAREIADALPDVFTGLGYACDPDAGLDPLTADRNWVRLVGDEIKEAMRRATEGHRAELKAKDDRIAELDRHCDDLTRRLRESVTLSGPVARAVKRAWRGWKDQGAE
ncbi:MAG TPA: sulfotransferase domain-containing protein [Gemmataceae bacterium]|nr:sulfotransferase domain-containing protein [Gemmataceae bacterium]